MFTPGWKGGVPGGGGVRNSPICGGGGRKVASLAANCVPWKAPFVVRCCANTSIGMREK